MAHECNISQHQRETQELIFRVCQKDGLSLKAISFDSGIPYSTLRTYAGHSGATAEMPVSALYKLSGVVPDELLSLLLPNGRQIVQAPESIDHDAIADLVRDYLQTKDHAHREDSPAGRDISACEDDKLRTKLTAVTTQVAA